MNVSCVPLSISISTPVQDRTGPRTEQILINLPSSHPYADYDREILREMVSFL